MAVSINGTSGLTFNDGTSVGTASSLGMRNRIINGAMEIDQRNAGAAVTTTGSFPVDRYSVSNATDGAFSAQRSTTAPAGFINSLYFTTTTADASLGATQYASIVQAIEGFNIADLGLGTANAKTFTLSFWVRSSLTGTFGGAFLNNANNRSYPFTYVISSANTWEYKTVTVAGDTTGTWLTDNSAGLKVCFGLGVGSTYSGTAGSWSGSLLLSATGAVSVIGTLNATFYLTGVQLEVGSVATPFERRLYPQELAMCQRYFEYASFNVYGYQSTTGEVIGGGVNFRAVKRAQPTLGSIVGDTGATPTSSNVASQGVNTPGLYGCAIYVIGSTSAPAGVNQRGYMFSASSEL